MGYMRVTRWTCDQCGRIAEREFGGLPEDEDGKWAFVHPGHACPPCLASIKKAGLPVARPVSGAQYTRL